MSNKIEFENGSIIESIDNIGQTIRGKIRSTYIETEEKKPFFEGYRPNYYFRNLTDEEEKSCEKSLERISAPTGISLFEEKKELDKYELRDYINLRMYDEMKHCIGYEGKAKRGTYKYWRNYFCTNENDTTWDKLVEFGLAKKSSRENMIFYCLSEKGIDFVAYIEGINIKEEK